MGIFDERQWGNSASAVTRGLADVTAAEVTQAVLRESIAVSVSATQNFVAGLRALLRFCVVEGLMHVDLAQAALPVTGRRRSRCLGSPPPRPGPCSRVVIDARPLGGATTR